MVYFFGTEEGEELRSSLYDGASDLEKELKEDFEKLVKEGYNNTR